VASHYTDYALKKLNVIFSEAPRGEILETTGVGNKEE
jgi:hypothetical protein